MRLTTLIAAALILASCGSKQDGAAPGGPGGGVPSVTVATPLIKPIVDWDDYVGRFEPIRSVDVRPRVSGYITKITFTDGQFAKAGDLLFVIDPRPFEAALGIARGDEARAGLRRGFHDSGHAAHALGAVVLTGRVAGRGILHRTAGSRGANGGHARRECARSFEKVAT